VEEKVMRSVGARTIAALVGLGGLVGERRGGERKPTPTLSRKKGRRIIEDSNNIRGKRRKRAL
jgi:hypothetical protein